MFQWFTIGLFSKYSKNVNISFNLPYSSAALLATQMLPVISRGDMYKQLEWVLLDAHANLLEILSESQAGNEKLIVQRCERLSALIVHSTIPQNDQLLALQEKVSLILLQTVKYWKLLRKFFVKDGWMTCRFTFFSILFRSYQADKNANKRLCAMESHYGGKDF